MKQSLKMTILLVLSINFVMLGAAKAGVLPAVFQITEKPDVFGGFNTPAFSVLSDSNQSAASIFGNAASSAAAIYTVDTTADDAALTACTSAPNDCSLRGAISSAPAGTDINFSVTGTITLTGGDIAIAKNLTITAPASAPGITVSGNNASRIFDIEGSTVALSGLTLSGGNGNGGDGYWNGYGGAIINGGVLTLTNCIISGSTAEYFGGGVYNRDQATQGSIVYGSGTLTVTNSTISGNVGSRTGGGIWNGGALTVIGSTFSNNNVNTAFASQGGGGIFNQSTANVSSSTFSSNSALLDGGAISNFGTVTVTSSTFNGNTASNFGGALYNYNYGTMTLTNSTLFGNKAPTYFGGGIYNYGTLTVSSATISGNSAATRGGGIWNGGTLNLSNSIVAGNTVSNAANGSDIYGSVSTGDYNLVQNTASASLTGTHNVTGQPAMLGTLANNGGLTQTMALLSNSQAVNAGDPNFDQTATPFDQRGSGFPRVQNGRVDIGAFESAFVNRVPLATDVSFTAMPNTAFSGQLTVRAGADGDTLTYSIVTGTLPAGLTLDQTTGIISGTPTAPSHTTFTFKAIDNHGAESNTATATFDVAESPSLVVTTTNDVVTNDNLTSLREAVAYAQSGSAGANPVITFSVTGVIELKSPAISIAKDLTINGPGAGNLALSGIGNDGGNASPTSIFNISGGIVSISGLTLRDGTGTYCTNNSICGGAVYQTGGTVTVTSSALSNNNANNGGAIYINGGSLTVVGSTISNNNLTAYNYGGGIYEVGGSVTITNSTVSGNTAGFGAGIVSAGGTLSLTNSTVSGNTAKNYTTQTTITCNTPEQCQNPPQGFTCPTGYYPATCTGYVSNNGRGGGIFNVGGTVNITNSTISGNVAQGYDTTINYGGGGIDNRSNLTIANSTVTNNSGSYGGGVQNRGTLNLSNSIVAGNTATHNPTDIYNFPNSSVSGNYNLVQNGDAITGTGNITGQDAKLGALANNGGATQTHALIDGSPAIDMGDPNFNSANLPYDQRGAGFPRVVNGRVDIGAYEGYIYQNNLVVNTLDDHDDGSCAQSDCTLREAVKYAAAAGATVTFSVSGTITLTQGEIVIVKNVSINGPTTAPGITISGNNQSRIFSVGSTSGSNTLSLSNLTLTKGNGVGSANNGTGGAVSSSGTLTVANCTFVANTATTNGGAIRSSSILTVTSSTFYGNTATGTGGAIQFGNSATITNSTISGNTATGNGGGINNNSGAQSSSPVTLSNSIVAGNSAPTGPDFNGKVTGGDYNLIQNTSGATLSGTHNITGVDPKLDTLKTANGGPTATMALLSGSPAIDAGDLNFDTTATPYDQRGSGYARKVGGAIDIGAFEVQPPPAASADLTVAKSHTGNFTQGDSGKTYSITVANSGGTATGGTVTITDTLPAGLTATAISGTGWTCTQATLSCTRTDALAAAGSYPAITLTVNVAADAPASVTNTATVSGGGESNTANNTALDATTINAAATYSISGQVIYGTTPTGSAARGVPGVVLNASGTPSATAASISSGIYQLSGLGSGAYTVTPSKSGDVNHITVNDALLVQQYGAYATDLTPNQLIAADTNSDNLVNSSDALYIQQYLAYVNTATANIIEQWKFLPASRNYTLSSNQTNQNYTAVLVGDVDGDWVAPGGTNAPLRTNSAANEFEDAAIANETNAVETNANDTNVNQSGTEKPRLDGREPIKSSSPSAPETAAAVSSVTVSLPTNATSSAGTSVTIPITVSQLPALGDANAVKTYAFNVQYDATVLQFTGFDTTGTLSGSSGVVCGQPPPDATNNRIVACNYVNINGITGQGTLVKLNFTVIGTSGQQSALTFVGTARQPDPFVFNTGDPQAGTANGSFTVTAPTAAAVSVGGRVLTASGRGVSGVRITLTDLSGDTKTVVSTAFGYYRFDTVLAGGTYIITANGKRFQFSQPTQVVNVSEDTFDINFTANPLSKSF